jgi:hypothetical protein
MRASTTVFALLLAMVAWPSIAPASTEGCISERGRGLHPNGYDIVVAGVIVANVPDPDHVAPEVEDPWRGSEPRPVLAVTIRPVAAWKGVPPGTMELELSTPSSTSYPDFEVGSFRLLFADQPAPDDSGQLPRVTAYCSHLRSVSDIFTPQRRMKWISSPEWYLSAEDESSSEPSRQPPGAIGEVVGFVEDVLEELTPRERHARPLRGCGDQCRGSGTRE